MKTISIRCSGCGAPYDGEGYVCDHCGSALVNAQGNVISAPKERMDFGWEGSLPIILSLIVSMIIYFWGWMSRYKTGYLTDNVIIVWYSAIPLWIMFMTAIWRTRSRITFLQGLLYALPFLPLHFVFFSLDAYSGFSIFSFGIAGTMFGSVYVSWCVGRIIHGAVRKRMTA